MTMTLTLAHKKTFAAVTLVAALAFVLIFMYVDGNNRSRLPDIPVLQGAKNVQRSVNIGASGTPIDPLEVVSFVIDDESQQVEQYVRGAMQQKGWRQDRCCHSRYTHLNRDPERIGSYMADVSIMGGGSTTYVTIRMTHGTGACDCIEKP